MCEVEPQIIWRYHRPCLLHMRSQNFTQRGMHQVRCRMVAPRGVSLLDVNFSGHDIANFQTAFSNLYFVDDQTLCRRVSVDTVRDEVSTAGVAQPADVPNLSAAFCIEGSLIENNLPFFTFIERLD